MAKPFLLDEASLFALLDNAYEQGGGYDEYLDAYTIIAASLHNLHVVSCTRRMMAAAVASRIRDEGEERWSPVLVGVWEALLSHEGALRGHYPEKRVTIRWEPGTLGHMMHGAEK